MAPNMSVGVNVTLKLLEMAAKRHGDGVRHRDHRSAPPPQGGRSLGHFAQDGEVIAEALGVTWECAVYAHEGVTGERDPSSIGFATIRGGDIVVTIRCCLPARVSASRSRTNRPAGPRMPRAACAPCVSCGHKVGMFDMFDDAGTAPTAPPWSPLHWWSQGDAVTQATALLLLAMSVASWVVVVWKLLFLRRARSDVVRCMAAFWQAFAGGGAADAGLF